MDRVKPVFIPQDRRALRAERATHEEISQLRSVLGSVSWFARTCRPDLAFAVNQLQSVQSTARVQDLIEAITAFSATPSRPRTRACCSARIQSCWPDCVILPSSDASHGSSFEDLGNGRLGGNRP